jgi:hypothetical protein
MKFYFDFELHDNLPQPPDPDHIAITKMRSFIISRFKALEDKIDAAQKDGEFAMVVFYSHKDTIELRHIGIPIELLQKFEDCLTQDDMDYIHESIYQELFGKSSGGKYETS